MLTKPSSAIAIAILTTGAILALDTASATAGPRPVGRGGGGKTRGTSGIRMTTTTPSHAPARRSGGGKGKTNEMPCPAGQVCNQITVGANPPPAALPATEVAMEARAAIEPPQPTVHTAPANRTYVQLRTGLWVDGFTEVQQPLTLGGTTVVLYADPKTVTWNMGEGTVTCETAGSRSGKTCGYTYNRSSAGQPGGKYRISATITWYLHWTCTGGFCDAAGGDWGADSTESRTSEVDLAVGEVQTESRPG